MFARVVASALLLAVSLAGCERDRTRITANGTVHVVATEPISTAIAREIAPPDAVVSFVDVTPGRSPSLDEAHEVALADVVVVNGATKDDTIHRLVDAAPRSTRTVIDVARLVGGTETGPARWYDVAVVRELVRALGGAVRLWTTGRDSTTVVTNVGRISRDLARWDAAIVEIRARHDGERVGLVGDAPEPLLSRAGLRAVTSRVDAARDLAAGHLRALVVTRDRSTGLAAVAARRGVGIARLDATMPAGDRPQGWWLAETAVLARALDAGSTR